MVGWDHTLFGALNGLAGRSGALDAVIVAIATGSVLAYAALLAGLLLWPGGRFLRGAAFGGGAAAVALVLNQVLVGVVDRPRPFTDGAAVELLGRSADPSFPSDHAAGAMAIALGLWVAGRRRWAAAAAGAAVLVGVARVAGGAHYPGDVLGGFATAAVGATAVWLARRPLDVLVTRIGRVRAGAAGVARRGAVALRTRPRLVLLGGAAVLAVVAANLAEDVANRDPLVRADARLASWIHLHRTDDLDILWRGLAVVGGATVVLAAVTAVATVVWRRGLRALAAYLMVVGIGAEALTVGLKRWMERPRPPAVDQVVHVDGWSFPSGHALVAAAIATAVVVVVYGRRRDRRRGVVLLAVAAALAVGLSRLALDVHYLSDVLAGWTVGAAWALVAAAAFGPRLRSSGSRPAWAPMDAAAA